METKEKPVIQVKNLYKLYRVGDSYVKALNGVNLEIYKGEFCSIVGTSGSGKSTLLNMLAGLEKPTRGEIIIAGEHMENKTENQLVRFRREHLGFIFQMCIRDRYKIIKNSKMVYAEGLLPSSPA